MTRLDVQSTIQSFFSDPTYYQTFDMNDSIQDGLDEICAYTGCVLASTVIPFQENLTYYDFYTLIPGYVGVWAIYNPVINRWLIPVSLRKLQQTRIDWDVSCGTPNYFASINFRYVAIFRKPSVPNYGNMYIFYFSAAPTLSDTTLLPIPTDSQTVIENYCEMDLLAQNEEWDQASALMQTYEMELETLRQIAMEKRNLGRVPQLR